MGDGADTRTLVDALIRYLDECEYHQLSSGARSLAGDLAWATNADSGDARALALLGARDTARGLRSGVRELRKQALRDDRLARADLEFVSDASPWIGQERLSQAQHKVIDSERAYRSVRGAAVRVRVIIRSIDRDLAREVAAARGRGTSRVTVISRRLVEIGIPLAVDKSSRRQAWSDLDQLARGPRPRRAQLRYAARVLRGASGR